MGAYFEHIANWEETARKANWSVTGLAKLCHVSVRTLERHFPKINGKSPKAWLIEQRMKRAATILQSGTSIKVTSANLGYNFDHNFLRDFKKYWRFRPGEIQIANQREISQSKEIVVF